MPESLQKPQAEPFLTAPGTPGLLPYEAYIACRASAASTGLRGIWCEIRPGERTIHEEWQELAVGEPKLRTAGPGHRKKFRNEMQ